MSYKKMMKRGAKGIRQMYIGFNPSGITPKEIEKREAEFINEMENKSKEERVKYWRKASRIIKLKRGSWRWEWCVFKRHFVFENKAI